MRLRRPAARIRVLWLVKGLGPGGAERLLTLSARRRDRGRFAIRVGYLLPHKTALVPDLEAEGVPVACLGRTRLADLRWLWDLRRSLVAEPVDVVHAHSPLDRGGGTARRAVDAAASTTEHGDHRSQPVGRPHAPHAPGRCAHLLA